MGPSNLSGVTNFFPTPNEGFTTTLGETISSGATTVPLNATTGLVNGTVFVGIIEPGAANEQVFTGIVNVSDLEITGVIWTRGTNVGHTGGVTIVDYVTGTAVKMISTGILVDHNQAGDHQKLHDVNGNLWIDQGATASAVNNLKVSNSATGNPIALAAEGSDTNISYNIVPKGTGVVEIGGTQIGPQFLKNPYKFLYTQGSGQSLTANTSATVTIATKVYDTGSNFNTSTYTFTAPVTGYWTFFGSCQVNLPTDNQMGCNLIVNGVNYPGSYCFNAINSNQNVTSVIPGYSVYLVATQTAYMTVDATANSTVEAVVFGGRLESLL